MKRFVISRDGEHLLYCEIADDTPEEEYYKTFEEAKRLVVQKLTARVEYYTRQLALVESLTERDFTGKNGGAPCQTT